MFFGPSKSELKEQIEDLSIALKEKDQIIDELRDQIASLQKTKRDEVKSYKHEPRSTSSQSRRHNADDDSIVNTQNVVLAAAVLSDDTSSSSSSSSDSSSSSSSSSSDSGGGF